MQTSNLQLSLSKTEIRRQEVNLAPYDGELFLFKQFYDQHQADALFSKLISEIVWQEETLFIYGKWHKVPRLISWYGDANAFYRYSGKTHQPSPWTPELLAIKKTVQQHCCVDFNSVLLNLYRNGLDSMGCHADDEKELGEKPLIASLSFGAERLLKFRHKIKKTTLDIRLGNGDLLIMADTLQQYWHHSLPKTKRVKTPRINLTFRHIILP